MRLLTNHLENWPEHTNNLNRKIEFSSEMTIFSKPYFKRFHFTSQFRGFPGYIKKLGRHVVCEELVKYFFEKLSSFLQSNLPQDDMQNLYRYCEGCEGKLSFNMFLSAMALLVAACSKDEIRAAFGMFDKVRESAQVNPCSWLTGTFIFIKGIILKLNV